MNEGKSQLFGPLPDDVIQPESAVRKAANVAR